MELDTVDGLTEIEDDATYNEIVDTLNKKKQRIKLSISNLNKIIPGIGSKLIDDPYTYFPPAEEAIELIAQSLNASLTNPILRRVLCLPQKIRLGLSGWLGANSVTARGITSTLVNKMFLVEGVVTRATHSSAQLITAVYFSITSNKHFVQDRFDNLSVKPASSRVVGGFYDLIKNADNQVIELEPGLSVFRNIQIITVQELPEVTPAGSLPRSIDIVCMDDLVDQCRPGDRLRVTGVLRCFPHKQNNVVYSTSRSLIIANNIEIKGRESICDRLNKMMIARLREIAEHPRTLEILALSICPSICGHENIKKAVALQLVGGSCIISGIDHLRQRGDIHVLLIGDPSCGKSQILRFAMNLSPLSISTTGRGSSAVGLTAAVTTDPDTGIRRLEAGVMVLADGGLVCIDEFDKMDYNDRVAVHEVMEQQCVSINKAGITATLNARTTILAAANPLYGSFKKEMDFSRQIDFPDSLLSRFDLIFMVFDAKTPEDDRRIARQVLNQLRIPQSQDLRSYVYKQRQVNQVTTELTTVQPEDNVLATNNNDDQPEIWTQHPAQILDDTFVLPYGITTILKPDIVKLYLAYCKQMDPPVLTAEANEEIAHFYTSIRQHLAEQLLNSKLSSSQSLPTPRLLEACIRLATAHAKIKMKKTVDRTDVEKAKQLLLYSLLGLVDEDENEASDKINIEPFNSAGSNRLTSTPSIRSFMRTPTLSNQTPSSLEKSSNTLSSIYSMPRGISTEAEELYAKLRKIQRETDDESWPLSEVRVLVPHLKEEDLIIIINSLQKYNRLMLIGDRVYII